MTDSEAAAVLGVPVSASEEEIRRRYDELHAEYRIRIDSAPTAMLRERYASVLHELSEARSILVARGGAESAPPLTDLPVSHPVSPIPEPPNRPFPPPPANAPPPAPPPPSAIGGKVGEEIFCVNCRRPFAAALGACPHCGPARVRPGVMSQPSKPNDDRATQLFVLAVAVVILIWVLVRNAINSSSASDDTGAATTSARIAPPPVTVGGTVEVRMIGDGTSYRFQPADVVVKPGGAVRFTMVSGAPHNIAFEDVPAAARAQLSANMPGQIAELAGPMIMEPDESYTVSFANIPPGTYRYYCAPHLAMGMVGTVTVR